MANTYILKINPATWPRVTHADRKFFRIPRNKLYPAGLRRLEKLEKYNEWKASVLAEAHRLGFVLPEIGAGVIFYIPVPPSWSGKKKKLYHGQFHATRPDLSNLLKAFEDAMLPQDMKIAFYTHLGKRWVNADHGWIEVTVANPKAIFLLPPSIGGEKSLQ